MYPTAKDFYLHDLEMREEALRNAPDSNRVESSRLRPPDSVVDFNHKLDHMSELEQDLKQTAVDLQKKLGISGGGMVY